MLILFVEFSMNISFAAHLVPLPQAEDNEPSLLINSNISFSKEITEIINDCILKNVKVISVDKKILSKLSNNNNAQNIIFKVKKKKFLFSDLNINDVHVAIDGIKDPGNLGTILRTINAFGINSLILVGDTVNQIKKELKIVEKDSLKSSEKKREDIVNNPKCLLILKKGQKMSRNEKCEATGKKFKNCCGAL